MPERSRAGRGFFSTSSEKLARALLGTVLVRVLDDGTRLAGMIVETEAYCGVKDRGSHAYGGRRSQRNESMYGPPGTSYVYFTYGMHYCMNIVCGAAGDPLAVLLRALEPLEGIDFMREARGPRSSGRPHPDTDLCSGPGKLCQALRIDRAQDGLDMVTSRTLFLEITPQGTAPRKIQRTARIGLGSAGTWTYKPLRWHFRGHGHVSRARIPRPPGDV